MIKFESLRFSALHIKVKLNFAVLRAAEDKVSQELLDNLLELLLIAQQEVFLCFDCLSESNILAFQFFPDTLGSLRQRVLNFELPIVALILTQESLV
jgi:hypothetical protein